MIVVAVAPAALHARSCDSLAQLELPRVSITLAQIEDSGVFPPAGKAEAFVKLPVFCRVVARLTPSSDSEINTEIWLPVSGWNGKFLAVGNGGWGGSIVYVSMAEALRRGYATSATDDGHTGGGAGFILGHPEKFVDFAYRAEHEMTVTAKTLIQAFYGRKPKYSYWNGCSGGGREGLLQAYRYPGEFDGIIAGDPANLRRNAWQLWVWRQAFGDPDAAIPQLKLPMIHRAVLDACDANDGLRDGLIAAPESCSFDFKTLECPAADGPDCLTPRQVQTAETITSSPHTRAGHTVLPRLEPGSELEWAHLAGGARPADLFVDQFRYVVYQDPNWDWRRFDLERDFAKANAVDRNVDELDPHLAAFEKHGGKLLIYHGWADQGVPPGFTVEFYNSVLRLSPHPAQASNWIRLFMVPGMGHCGGGDGPNTFDKISLIEQWVEQGRAPTRIIASHQRNGTVDRTRPLCPYPQIARYSGRGSIDEAANFTCDSVRGAGR